MNLVVCWYQVEPRRQRMRAPSNRFQLVLREPFRLHQSGYRSAGARTHVIAKFRVCFTFGNHHLIGHVKAHGSLRGRAECSLDRHSEIALAIFWRTATDYLRNAFLYHSRIYSKLLKLAQALSTITQIIYIQSNNFQYY